jgi:TolB-like protein/DNA-binding SARP family transcriptional activator
MTYDLRLLGRFQLLSPAGDDIAISSKKNQALLAILALAQGEAVTRSRLIGILWAERGEDQARSSLRQGFTALRKALGACGPFPLRVDDEEAAIDLDALRVDTLRFAEAGAGRAPEALERALAFWRGELLEGLAIPDQAVQDWLGEARRGLQARYLDALSRLLAIREGAGDYEKALAAAQCLLASDPVNEEAQRAVMRCHARTGDRGKALKQYQVCKEVLRRDLGVDPEPATEDLFRQIAGGSLSPEQAGEPGLSEALDLAGPSEERPSIAVLPFTNLSGDAAQEFFADGIADNITTELSRFRDLFVIARDSSFTYKGKTVKVQEASRDLGVRYLLEGSVQRSEDRVRISVQLIDGTSGQHLWVERYDRQLDDIFALQDEVTQTIVATLASGYGGRLRKAWQKRPETRHPGNVKSFDCFLRAMDLFDRFTKEAVAEAKPYFEEAIRLDPSYAKAHSKLAWAHMVEAAEGWSEDHEVSLAKGHECALASIAADDNESWAHWALAGYYAYAMQHDLAIYTFERALELNPNDADVLTDVGYFLCYAGRAEEGLVFAKKAMELNPYHPEWYLIPTVIITDPHEPSLSFRWT